MVELTHGKQIEIKKIVIPALVATVALGIAIVGALLTGNVTGGVTGGVETLSSSSANFLTRLTTIVPVGFAFGAGMVSAVNPCGFAMLPAYLGLYLGNNSTDGEKGLVGGLRSAIMVGSVVTAGFAILFGVTGILFSIGVRSLADFFPWIGMTVGVILAIAGAWLITGGSLYTSIAERVGGRLGDARQTSVRGYFAFGISYGVASLSCTLPIFLAVVGSSVAVGGLVGSIAQFFLYALGMGTVIMALTISMAIFKGAMLAKMRQVLPYVAPISAGFMLVAGAYIVYYWLTIGGLLA